MANNHLLNAILSQRQAPQQATRKVIGIGAIGSHGIKTLDVPCPLPLPRPTLETQHNNRRLLDNIALHLGA